MYRIDAERTKGPDAGRMNGIDVEGMEGVDTSRLKGIDAGCMKGVDVAHEQCSPQSPATLMCMFSLVLACSANSRVYDLVPVNQAADLNKKAEYGHLKLQPVAMTMNQWGSAVCIIQPAIPKQRCIVSSNATAVEYRDDVSYNMSKGGGGNPAVQHKSTNDASTEPVVVRMSE